MTIMTIENKQHGYVTYDEFNHFVIKTDQRFEDLTEIMLREFDKVYIEFGKINDKFDQVYGEFAKVNGRIDKLESRMGAMELRMDKIESRIGTIESMLYLIVNHLGIKFTPKIY